LIRKRFESSVGAISGRLSRAIDKNGSLSSLVKTRWIEVLYVIGIVAMASGIVNAVIQPVDSRYIIFPGQGSQSITETVINALALMLGATGIYLSYLSGRQTTKPRMVTFYLILGLLLLGTGIYIGIYVYSSK
jgi:hypothetical protein